MAIPLLPLDDRKFTDLVDELRALIPRYSKTWTDYNVSDPGIMLAELFAWLTETLLYRINRVPEASRVRLLELLGAVFQPAAPAIIQVTITDEDLVAPSILPSGTRIQAKPTPSSDFIVFETMADVKFAPEAPVQTVLARQTLFIEKQTVGTGNGEADQIIELPQRYLVLPTAALRQSLKAWGNPQLDELVPTVLVDKEPWAYQASYLAMGAAALTYTFEPWRNALRFGNGAHGAKPGAGLPIAIAYHATRGAAGNVPIGTTFAFNPRETGRARLRVEERFATISLGRDPTGSHDVAEQIFELLHAQWRAITSMDLETVIRANFQEIAQVYCLPGQALAANASAANQPGQLGVILAPQPTAQWRAAMRRVQEILGLTPNGQRLVARDQEGVVHLWDAQRGERLTPLGGNLRDLAFSPDGRQLAVVGDDHRLQLWTRETGHGADLFVHPAAVKHVAFDAQGQYLATACADNLVRVWRTTTMQAEPAFVFQHAAPVSALAFHPDEACLLSASLDGVAKIWYLNNQQPAGCLPCPDHKAAIFALAFSPDGRYLATAGLDRTVFLWLWPALKLIGVFPHTAAVLDVAFHPHQRQLVAACQNGTAQLWDIESGTLVSLFQHAGPVNAVAIDPTGQYLATASADRTVGLWDLHNAQKVTALEHNAAVHAVDFYDAQTLATACDDYGVRVWDLADIGNPQCKRPFLTAIQTVNFSPDGRRLSTITDQQTARLWDTETGADIVNLATQHPVNKVVFSADSQRLATAHAQDGVHVWDAQQGNLLAFLPADVDNVATVDLVFRPDNQQLVTVDAHNQVRLWDLIRPPQLICAHQAPVIQGCFSGDGQRLATITDDGFALVWNAATGETLFKQPLTRRATTVGLDQNGACLVTADSRQLTFWDVPKQQVDFTLAWEQIQNVAFDPHDRWFAASTQKSVYVLDRKTKETVGPLEHEEPVTTLIFHPNGEQLATVTANGVVHLWDGPAWDIEKGKLVHTAALRRIVFAQKSQQWITFATDQTLSRWDGSTGEFIASSNLAIDNVDLIDLSPDGEQIATVFGGTQLRIQAVANGAIGALLPQTEPVRQLFFHPTLAQLVTVNRDAKVYFWSTQPVEPALILPCATAISDVRFNQDGTRLVIRLADQRAQLWSTRTVAGKPPRLITELGNDVSTLAFSPDGQRLATVHETVITAEDPPQLKQQVRLWSTKRGAPEGELLCARPVWGLIFSPSNQRLLTIQAAASEGYRLQLWDLRLKNCLRPLRSAPLVAGKTVLINATGQWLAQVTERLLHIWDIEQAKQISTLYIDFTDPQVQADPWLLHYLDPKNNSHQVIPIGSQASTLATQLYFTQGKFLLATSGDQQPVGANTLRPATNGFSGSVNGNGLAARDDTQTLAVRAIQVWNAEHVYAVDHLLNERRLLTTQAHVAGPQYADVTLPIQVVRKSTAKSITRLQTDVTNALLQFFHPLSGGPDGKGWPPGRDVYRSEVYQVIESVEGVDHVASLQFDPPEKDERVVIPPYQRVNAVVHLEISDSAVSQLWPVPRSSALWLPQRQAVI